MADLHFKDSPRFGRTDTNGGLRPGDDVIVPPSVTTEEAKKKFGEVREVKP